MIEFRSKAEDDAGSVDEPEIGNEKDAGSAL